VAWTSEFSQSPLNKKERKARQLCRAFISYNHRGDGGVRSAGIKRKRAARRAKHPAVKTNHAAAQIKRSLSPLMLLTAAL
jgi:hypothetical protein